MSNRCKVCNHELRAEIDQCLIEGQSLRSVAEQTEAEERRSPGPKDGCRGF